MSATDTNQQVTVGFVFTVENRRLNKQWKGSLPQVCAQMQAAAFDVSSMWNDADTKVVAQPAQVGLFAVLGGQSGVAAMGQVLPAFKEAIAMAGDGMGAAIQKLASQLHRDQRLALLRLAAAIGRLSVVDKLYLGTGDLTEGDRLGMTPLAWACAFGRIDIVRWALEQKLVVDSVNHFTANYCDLAWANKHGDICDVLIGAGVAVHGQTLALEMQARGIVRNQRPDVAAQ